MMKFLLLIQILILFQDSTVYKDCTGGNKDSTSSISNKDLIGLDSSVPNPAGNYTTVSYHLGFQGVTSLRLYNMLGKAVLTLVNEAQKPGNYIVSVDVSALPEGTYFYVLTAGNRVKTKRLIVDR